MKSENIVRSLRKLGHEIDFVRFGFWDNVPRANKKTVLAQHYCVNYTQGIRTDFKLADVISAIESGCESVGEYLEY